MKNLHITIQQSLWDIPHEQLVGTATNESKREDEINMGIPEVSSTKVEFEFFTSVQKRVYC